METIIDFMKPLNGNGCFNIVQQLAGFEAQKMTGDAWAELKETYSLRTLPITDEVLCYFRQQRERRVAPITPDSDFVVCWEDGRHLSEAHISHEFNKLLKDNGLPYMRFHDLRHTAATNMHQLTGDFYTVGEILGHSLKGIGNQLGIIGGLEAVTERYVDVRLERKRVVLESYHKAVLKKRAVSKSDNCYLFVIRDGITTYKALRDDTWLTCLEPA